MRLINIDQTLILNKLKPLPSFGIICAHPDRAKRIAEEYLTQVDLHTDYRGFQVYTGNYQDQAIFVGNTGIGASAAAFLIEELSAFGVKRLLRLGSHDGKFKEFCIKVVEKTTLPVGLCLDYGFESSSTLKISETLKTSISQLAKEEGIPIEFGNNRHLDGYHAVNFFGQNVQSDFNSQDMESGALYLLAQIKEQECLSLLISYPKHETGGEYLDGGASKTFEGLGIEFALKMLMR